MEFPQSPFSPSEYLTTFTTFIYGYVATHFLSGWSSMITHRKSITFSKEHLAWTIFTFILLIDIWWTSWRKAEIIATDNLVFYSTLITPFIFYFISHLLFPDLDQLLGNNLKTYLTPTFKKLMVAMIFLLLSFLLSDRLFTKHYPQNVIFIFSGIILAGLLIVYPSALLLRRSILAVASTLVLIHLYLLFDYPQPFYEFNGFSFTEYLTVFITFIYGFVTWRFLEGWGLIIIHFKKLKIGYDYLPWTVMGFLLMLDIWWGSGAREAYLSVNILYFLLAMAVPILFYFFSSVIFPLELLRSGFVSLNHHYSQNKKALCVFFGMILVSNSVVANVMEETSFLSLENMFRFFGIVLSISGIITSQLVIHRVILLLGLATIAIHAYTE